MPVVGLEVTVVDLGHREAAVVEEVRDGGREIVVAGERYALHELTGHWVRVGDPYYGRRVALGITPGGPAPRSTPGSAPRRTPRRPR